MSPIVQGTLVRVPFTTVDVTGALFDASAITAVIVAPDGTRTTLSLAGATIARASLGTYYFTILADQATTGTGLAYVLAVTATVGGFVTVEPLSFGVTADPTL